MAYGKRRIFYREDVEYDFGTLTIERKLQMYEQHPDRSERSATLWHTWRQNKNWLIRLLELTLASFPAYSRHDATHAETVLHNIERILGEERIDELSATDCFAILHIVYIHDIGMAILAADRENIVKSDEFVEMIDNLLEGADKDLKKAATLLKKEVYFGKAEEEIDHGGIEYHNAKKNLYKEKLQTYYAVVQLLAEYQRKRHGEKVVTNVKDWLLDGDKLRSEFSMSGIPMRIFFRIADCASLHTDWDFGHILDLPAEENGYDSDMLHPRFVAVLLQLGDALDIDNDRFHPFAQAYLGQFPMQSRAHYDKHLAIRMLKITPEEIVIEADCKTREAIRLIKNECDGIENLLKSASYYWSSIAPRGFGGALPSFHSPKLLLDGIEIPLDLAKAPFRISQQKAFSLLQGENLYSGYFPFVRELLQNAVDSTKVQAYMDYMTSSKFRFEDDQAEIMQLSIKNISKIINPVEYPIEITIACCRLTEEDVHEEIDLESVPNKEDEEIKYGILFSIKDYGTGIDSKTLRAISATGTGYNDRKGLLRSIPDWLRPTGEFGIGLHSVFLVCDKFYCETYLRDGRRYCVEFLKETNGEKGYFNVQPKDANEEPMAYGTEFQVFIDHSKKKIRSEFMDAWAGYDPFADEYEAEKIQRDIIALTTQIILDIDGQLEDLLFPVYTSVKFDLGKECREQLERKLSHVVFSDTQISGRYTKENLKEHVCWMYQHERKNDFVEYMEIENGFCMVDLWKMRINLWLEDVSVNACIGVENLVRNGFQVMKFPCKLYYKGILIGTRYFDNSDNLLEYIDIQGVSRGKKLIQLDRNGFTKEGELYIDTIIIPKIYEKLQKVLEALANLSVEKISTEDKNTMGMADKMKKNIEKAFEKSLIDWKRQIIGISLYYNFYMGSHEWDKSVYISAKLRNEKGQWNQAIQYAEDSVNRSSNQNQAIWQISGDTGHIHVIEVYASLRDMTFTVLNERNISIADFYDRRNRFAVVSKRRGKGDNWINSLVWLKGTADTIKTETDTKIPEPKLIDVLKKKITETNSWSEKEENLEQWAEFLLHTMGKIIEDQAVQQSRFVFGLMKSVSISACFSDPTGNLKIHILSGRSDGGVFYNMHAKYMLLKKMAERNQLTNAERFAGNAWMGYEFLQIRDIQDDVCNIKENYISENETYMIMPCNGETSKELVQFADSRKFDNVEWENINNKLVKIADELEACMAFDYQLCISEHMGLFDASYSNYCQREQKFIKKERFAAMLNRRYQDFLQSEFKKIKNCRQTEEKLSKEDLFSKLDKNFDREEVKVRNSNIMSEILLHEEEITSNEWYTGKDMPTTIHHNLKNIVRDCKLLKELWDQMEQLQMEQNFERIKNKFWDDTIERSNLIRWTAEQIHSNQDEVEECYERVWGEFKRVVEHHRKGKIMEEHHYRFIDWLEN